MRMQKRVVIDERTQVTPECPTMDRSLVNIIVIKCEGLISRIVGRVGNANGLDVALFIREVTCMQVGLHVRHIGKDLAFGEPYYLVERAIECRVCAGHDLRGA